MFKLLWEQMTKSRSHPGIVKLRKSTKERWQIAFSKSFQTLKGSYLLCSHDIFLLLVESLQFCASSDLFVTLIYDTGLQTFTVHRNSCFMAAPEAVMGLWSSLICDVEIHILGEKNTGRDCVFSSYKAQVLSAVDWTLDVGRVFKERVNEQLKELQSGRVAVRWSWIIF